MPSYASQSRFHLVVDGGGTKTDCCIFQRTPDGESVVGRGRSSGSNPAAIGVEAAAEAILDAVRQAASAANLQLSEQPVERAAFAVAGTLNQQSRDSLEEHLSNLQFARTCRVFPDVLPIALAASSSGEGAAVIAGTGSVGVARSRNGDLAVVGGWGYLLGDEGSGYALGRSAIREALRHLESGTPPTALAVEIQNALDAHSVDALKRAIYGSDQPRRRVASLATVVLQMQNAGDALAAAIVSEAANQLVELLESARAKLRLTDEPPGVAAAGGLMSTDSPLRTALEATVRAKHADAQIRFIDDPLETCKLLVSDACFHHPLNVVS